MEQTLITHPRLSVRIKTGSEGPHHDPYSYRETRVRVPNNEVVLHEGLGTWMKVNGAKVCPPKHMTYEQGEAWLRQKAFKQIVGYSMEQLERMHHKLTSRCRKCGGRQFHSESGYPGETFEVCDGCGNIQDSYFCESAVM